MTTDRNDRTRRDFLKSTSAAALASGIALHTGRAAVHQGTDETLRVGLVGCGGRGTGAAADALTADSNAEIVAVGDAFADQAERCISVLGRRSGIKDRVKVAPEKVFVGFDAYKQVIDSGVDVVLLATTPHFRPLHLAYAVEKNKHTFVEKPVAVDSPGVRSIMESCKLAEQRGLSIVSGLCYRYDAGKQALIEAIREGKIGDITAMNCNYCTRGVWVRPRKADQNDMEYQMRNWYYFTWLSGDFIAEQHIHSLDKMAWAIDDYPEKVSSMGGREVRTSRDTGHIYDHFASMFTYKNGARLFSRCRHQPCNPDVSDFVYGSKGTAEFMKETIDGKSDWKPKVKGTNMYLAEHQAFFNSIREGKPINNGDYMAKSTLMAIMARNSAYTCRDITWEEAMSDEVRLDPPAYEWGDLPDEMPGAPPTVKA